MNLSSVALMDLRIRPQTSPVEISAAELWKLQIPLGRAIGHFQAKRNNSDNLVAHVVSKAGVDGFGEAVPREYVTGETLSTATAAARHLLERFKGKRWETVGALLNDLEKLDRDPRMLDHPSARCAVELALLDCAGKTWGISVADMLGGSCRDSVEYSAVIPFEEPGTLDTILDMVKTQKVRSVKVKVGRSQDLETVESVRQKLGEGISLRLDANGAWSSRDAIEKLKALEVYEIDAIEQPVSKEDWQGLREVSESVSIRVIADESMVSLEDARGLIAAGACGGLNLRISKCGGLLSARRIYRFARASGIPCQMGCQVGETGILSAAGRHFAARIPDLLFAEGSFNRYILSEDIVEEDLTFGISGYAPVLKSPGLGITISQTRVQEYSQDRISCF